MKKPVLILACCAVLGLGFAGCQQCTTCTYEYTVNGDPATYSEEYCGRNSAVEKFESDFVQDAATVKADAVCTRK